MRLVIVDAHGRSLSVERLHRVVYNLPDKHGVVVESAYAVYTVVGGHREWKDAMPMAVFEKLNPNVQLK